MRAFERRIEKLEEKQGIGREEPIIQIMNFGESKSESCPGYEAKISEARRKALNGCVVIECWYDCTRACEGNEKASCDSTKGCSDNSSCSIKDI